MGPKIRDLRGHLSFTEDELRAEKLKMDEAGLPMPSFGTLESSLAKEMKAEESEFLFLFCTLSENVRRLTTGPISRMASPLRKPSVGNHPDPSRLEGQTRSS